MTNSIRWVLRRKRWEWKEGVSGEGELGTRCNIHVWRVLVGNSLRVGSGKARDLLGVFPRRVLTLPPSYLLAPQRSEWCSVQSSWWKLASEQANPRLMAYRNISYRLYHLSFSANKDVFSHSAGAWTFQGSGARYRRYSDLAGPLPLFPLVLFIHHFSSSAPRGQWDGQSVTTSWLTGVSNLVDSLGAECVPPHSPSYLLPPVRPYHSPFWVLASSPQLRAVAVFRDQSHRTFHDIMSAGGRDIKSPRTHFLSIDVCMRKSPFC